MGGNLINLTTALRYMSDQLENGIVNEINIFSGPRSVRLSTSVLPVVIGAKVVMVMSLLERIVVEVENMPNNTPCHSNDLKEKLMNLGFDVNWYGWEELKGIVSLRHCFAHEFGKVTERQKSNLKSFLQAFNKDLICDRDGKIIPAYFSVSQDVITLESKVSERLRSLSVDIIKQLQTKGLIVE